MRERKSPPMEGGRGIDYQRLPNQNKRNSVGKLYNLGCEITQQVLNTKTPRLPREQTNNAIIITPNL